MQAIERLLSSLNAASVRYLIIGATAFAAHGWVRATADLDLLIAPDKDNVRRLRGVLSDFGYDTSDATDDDFIEYKILLRQYDLPLDLHPFVAGLDSFDEAWSNRKVAELGDVSAPFASLDDLIRMKQAAGRPKDLEDLRHLQRLRDQEGH